VALTASVVMMVPIHNVTVMVPIDVMRRYSRITFTMPTAAATASSRDGVRPVQM